MCMCVRVYIYVLLQLCGLHPAMSNAYVLSYFEKLISPNSNGLTNHRIDLNANKTQQIMKKKKQNCGALQDVPTRI